MNFRQSHDESFYKAWERFKGMLKKCPNHQLDRANQICTFYNGLTDNHRTTIDAAAQGNLMQLTADEAWSLLENMTMHHHDYNINNSSNPAPLSESTTAQTEAIKSLSAQMETIAKQLAELKKQPQQVHQVQSCQNCTNPHPPEEYQVEYEEPDGSVYYAQFPTRSQFQPPGFSQNAQNQSRGTQFPPRNNQPPFPPRYPPKYPNFPQQSQLSYNQPLPLTYTQPLPLTGPTSDTTQPAEPNKTTTLATVTEDTLKQFIQSQQDVNQRTAARQEQIELLMRNQFSTIRSLEIQVGQLAQNQPIRQKGNLPSNTVHNPHVEEAKQMDSADSEKASSQSPVSPPVEKQPAVTQTTAAESAPQEVRIPYPGRLKNRPIKLSTFKLDGKFLDTMSRIPNRNRYIRKLLSTKDKIPEVNNLPLTAECSALFKQSLPEKLGDTGRFTFPCSIYQSGNISALADLGASIN